ncbi:MAG: PAS domain-containing protein [Calothrix sp. C42_A2020_038]|nr:PAS domain-containing protein [Calothrix sp. C42_A2020_038]
MVDQALRILLLQSEENAAKVLEQLKKFGRCIFVKQAASLVALETFISQSCWDVIIADYNNTQLCYLAILQALRKVKLEIPLILIANQIAGKEAVRALKAGVSDIVFISDIAQLNESINFELEAAAKQQQQEILERHTADAVLVGQNQVLELIVQGTPLNEVLNNLASVIERLSGKMKCSFLLLDQKETELYHDVADDLYDIFNQAVEGISIKTKVCFDVGAIKTRELVAVEDMTSDSFWSEKCDFDLQCGLNSCWCLPISTKSGELLGMLIVDYNHPSRPRDVDKKLITKAVHLAAVAIELTRTKSTLEQTQAQFQHLAANIPGAIYQFLRKQDGSHSFMFASPSCYEICELTPFEIQQEPNKLLDIVMRQDYSRLLTSIQRSADRLEPWEWEGRIITASGKEKWIKSAARPVRQRNGDILWDGLVMDITESKCTQAALQHFKTQLRYKAAELEQTLHKLQYTQMQLIQTEKMSSLGQLVAGIAHEINNPINFICNNINFANEYAHNLLGLLDLYQKYYPNPELAIQKEAEAIELDFLKEDFPKILSSMQTGTDRIYEIINGLRNFSRIEDTNAQNINIHDVIDSVLLILHHRLKANGQNPGINIIKEYNILPLIKCYPGQLNQVFMNLIANAIDALEESFSTSIQESPQQEFKPIICIRTSISDDKSHVIIKISDNGSGIPVDQKDQIFDAFFTTKPVGKGTGLGLSISQQIIVEKHGGKLQCISEPGDGTEFIVELPVNSETEIIIGDSF